MIDLTQEIPAMESATVGAGQPLVLVPGGLTGWASWIPHAEALSSAYRVIRVQLHAVALGLAGKPVPAEYSIDYEATALRKTMDDLSIARADIAGWSYGGLTALRFALNHPERVRSLTLIEPPAFCVLHSRGPLSRPLLEERAFFQSLDTDDVSEEQLVSFMRTVALVPEDVDPRTLPQWPLWRQHRQSLRTADHPYRHEINLQELCGFEKPVLLIKGEGSTAALHGVIEVLAQSLRAARVVSFPGAHAPHIVSMQQFLEEFECFLAAPEGTGGQNANDSIE